MRVSCEGLTLHPPPVLSPCLHEPSGLLHGHPPLPPIPASSRLVQTPRKECLREGPYLLILPNGSETRRLHVVPPAAQPVIISYRRHIRESVLRAAQSLGQREASGIPLGLGVAPRPCMQSYHGAVLHEALGSGIEQWPSVFQF